jgi:hypothetical protein
MTNEKYAAHTQNKTFYFYITQQNDTEISITMYNTTYLLIRNGETWENHHSNYFSMAQHLIDAVIYSIQNGVKADK